MLCTLLSHPFDNIINENIKAYIQLFRALKLCYLKIFLNSLNTRNIINVSLSILHVT